MGIRSPGKTYFPDGAVLVNRNLSKPQFTCMENVGDSFYRKHGEMQNENGSLLIEPLAQMVKNVPAMRET